VRIDLVVRGICCLRPGVPGISDNIWVRSIVGRFLEHSRLYYFHAQGQELIYAASADWMERNFHRRVETCFPLVDPALKARAMREVLETYLDDNTHAWELAADGTYSRVRPGKQKPRTAQEILLTQLAE
jgi:polyphosphate kinase